ncbi:MAG: HlyD family efflux transporter periplasmic adaptor subunit, partial [Burkholderiaceae bacterium]
SAQVREAWLAVQRTDVPAPVTGIVARRSVQVGQRVQAGTPLMSVVMLDRAWVDANFKEGQLERIRIGQPATLEADIYGKHVAYHGKVEGLGAGTGAAFSLLPAQNATGNWIKVVQRVPVRISLDPNEIAKRPLSVGLSMTVTVDVSAQGGAMLATTPRTAAQGAVASTTVFDSMQQDADAEVARIIAANGGGRSVARTTADGAPAPMAAGAKAAHAKTASAKLAARRLRRLELAQRQS